MANGVEAGLVSLCDGVCRGWEHFHLCERMLHQRDFFSSWFAADYQQKKLRDLAVMLF